MTDITRRTFMKTTAAGSAALLSSRALSGLAEPKKDVRPNVLFIMTDQQRFDAIGYVQETLPDYRDRARIHTPNLDRLLKSGACFSNAYTQCAVCGPSRTALRTGCTIERCGVQSNVLTRYDYYNRMEQFRDKVNSLESFEQILVEECGYQAAYFGKWHMPDRFAFKRDYSKRDDGRQGAWDNLYCRTDNPDDRVIRFNDVKWRTKELTYNYDSSFFEKYKRGLEYYLAKEGEKFSKACSPTSKPEFGPQYAFSFTGYPYDSVAIDAGNTLDVPPGGRLPKKGTQPDHVGRDTLGEKSTTTYVQGESARMAIARLAQEKKPFIVTASFHSPHAPMIATGNFFDKYWDKRKNMFVAPTHADSMEKSDYRGANARQGLLQGGLRYDEPEAIQEWTVAYYALCEEIDYQVGRLLSELETQGCADNTLVIFCSDHGEMLGAHGMREKNVFLEESARVPLLVKLPTRIKPGTRVDTPVSLLDVFSTILDYCGGAAYDRSDGTSLRRFIENRSWNANYDEEAIVTEWDYRTPDEAGKTLDRRWGTVPNFLCRKGPWKLMMTKKADSPLFDMLYNIDTDPYETTNLIYDHGKADWLGEDEMIGKAEHLKALLVDWMTRMDGDQHYYSDSKYNMGEGRGDITEIRNRRKWKEVDFWVSDRTIEVGPLAKVQGRYRKNVWIYFGTTTPGELTIESVQLKGKAGEASLKGFSKGVLKSGQHQRLAVCIDAVRNTPFKGTVEIRYRKNGKRRIKTVGLT